MLGAFIVGERSGILHAGIDPHLKVHYRRCMCLCLGEHGMMAAAVPMLDAHAMMGCKRKKKNDLTRSEAHRYR